MLKIFKFILVLAMALVFSNKSFATYKRTTDKASAEVIFQNDKINENHPLEVLVKFEMFDGWHIYSQNPGEIGLPTEVMWKLPNGYAIQDVSWSQDEEFVTDGIHQNGYGKIAYYRAKIVPLANSGLQKADLQAKISWLACKDECVPEKLFFDFSLPISKNDVLPLVSWQEELSKSQAHFMPPEPKASNGVLLIIFMAFVGGIVLNFMPCIFPILSIKAISLAQTSHDKKSGRIEAILYTLGVVSSFLLMATVLVYLRSKGEQIGWGFQLQSPLFVSIMIVIFFIIFLMLLDIVSIRNPFANRVGRISMNKQKINAFLTGFFAVLIASPCTAPGMGIAIGYTLAKPIYVYYPVFLSLSLGYALPFALVGFFPEAIHKILPKPGKWMDTLKKIFAIPIFLTCVWLAWVLYNQLNVKQMKAIEALEWNNYNEQKIAKLVDSGKPVFIDFTAKWCITCLFNEKTALSSEKFARFVKDKKITLFKADWTNNDADITAALAKYGRNSIPLYVYYDGKSDKYEIVGIVDLFQLQ